MEIYKMVYPLREEGIPQQVLAIGYFDGVHLGHQKVIKTAKAIAERGQMPLAVMTFHPHPREVLGKTGYASYLTPLQEKLKQFERLGVHHTYIVDFTPEFAALHPQEFIESFLMRLNVYSVVVGFDFTFGHRGRGTAETLREWAHGRYELYVVEPVNIEGEKVSSTLIREKLHEGDVEQAGELLGRCYLIEGEVVYGEQRGAAIGFPTTNLALHDPYVLPKTGVYVVKTTLQGQELYGVANIGYKPTFHEEENQPSIEVHWLDFSKDLYGFFLRVEFLTYLRPERKFPGVEALVKQIEQDVSRARDFLHRSSS